MFVFFLAVTLESILEGGGVRWAGYCPHNVQSLQMDWLDSFSNLNNVCLFIKHPLKKTCTSTSCS